MEIVDFILHVDKHLQEFVLEYDNLVYAILFLIIFVETGLVVMPFLPGDSLLFAAGMIAAQGSLNLTILIPLLLIATFSGDNTNFFIGKFLGHKATELKLFGKSTFTDQWENTIDTIFQNLLQIHGNNFDFQNIHKEVASKVELGCKIPPPNVVLLKAGPEAKSDDAVFESINMYNMACCYTYYIMFHDSTNLCCFGQICIVYSHNTYSIQKIYLNILTK